MVSVREKVRLVLLLASFGANEVHQDDDRRQNAETNCKRYSGVHPDIHAFVCLYAYTHENTSTLTSRCFNMLRSHHPQRMDIFFQIHGILLELLAHRLLCFSSIFSVLVIAMCDRQKWPALWSTFGGTII